jgi:hypothetical protein
MLSGTVSKSLVELQLEQKARKERSGTFIERRCQLNMPQYQHQAEPQFLKLGSCVGDIKKRLPASCLISPTYNINLPLRSPPPFA